MRFAPVALHPHPARPAGPLRGLTASGGIGPGGRMQFEFELHGDLDSIRIEKPAGRPQRRHELWRHTCFECFAAPGADPRYLELNFSTSGDWAAYAFAGYRERRADLGTTRVAVAARNLGREALQVDVEAGLDAAWVAGPDAPPGAAWLLNIAAVIEDIDGTLSYWAVHHPRPAPDFHDRAGFRVALPSA